MSIVYTNMLLQFSTQCGEETGPPTMESLPYGYLCEIAVQVVVKKKKKKSARKKT